MTLFPNLNSPSNQEPIIPQESFTYQPKKSIYEYQSYSNLDFELAATRIPPTLVKEALSSNDPTEEVAKSHQNTESSKQVPISYPNYDINLADYNVDRAAAQEKNQTGRFGGGDSREAA